MTDPEIRAQNLPIAIHGQYVRDLSFENPGAPNSLRPGAGNPGMDVAINLDARTIPDEKIPAFYEVSIKLKVKATRDQTPLFVLELDYGIAVSLQGIPEAQHHPVLLVEVPRLAFPFVRQAVADAVQAGGFPPLLLTPIDFSAMYLEQFGKKDAAAATA